MQKQYYVYILTNKLNEVLYVGVTSNLLKRITEHKNKVVEGFTKKYNLTKLVYFECSDSIESAIIREKQLKHWHRDWKFNLINEKNPEFNDLFDDLI